MRDVVVQRLGRRDDRARARREAREHLAAAAHGAAGAGAARRGLEPVLNVSFTTPFVPLREAMLGLFDDVVLSLHTVVRTPA